MPKDKGTIPPFGGLTRAEAEKLKKLGGGLAPAVGEELKKHGAALSPETREAFRPSRALDPRILSAQRASELLTTLRRDLADRKATLRQELEAREAATRREIEVLRRELEAREAEASQENEARRAAAGREIAGLEEQLREAEAWAEPFGVPRPRPAPTAASATLEPEPIAAAKTPAPVTPTPAEDDDSQEGLVRRFLDAHPNLLGKSAARIRKAMGGVDGSPVPAPASWTANESERLRRPKLTVPSLTTIRRELHERRLRSPVSA